MKHSKRQNTLHQQQDILMKHRINTSITHAGTIPPSQTPAVLPPEKLLLTQVEMAQRLGITRRTLHTWVQNRTVPMIKIRGFCRFDLQKVLAALEQYVEPRVAAPRNGITPIPQATAGPVTPAYQGI